MKIGFLPRDTENLVSIFQDVRYEQFGSRDNGTVSTITQRCSHGNISGQIHGPIVDIRHSKDNYLGGSREISFQSL